MAIIDTQRNVVVVRIVYDGPPLSGKTTSIHALSNSLGRTTEVFSLEESSSIPLHFDWMDYVGGFFEGYSISWQIVSVPGQLSLENLHRFLLHNADAVVFVLDASEKKSEISLAHFQNIQDILAQNTKTAPIKVVIQANKQDQSNALSAAQWKTLFKHIPDLWVIDSIATSGRGVREAFVLAVRLAIARANGLLAKGQLLYGKPDIASGKELLMALQDLQAADFQANGATTVSEEVSVSEERAKSINSVESKSSGLAAMTTEAVATDENLVVGGEGDTASEAIDSVGNIAEVVAEELWVGQEITSEVDLIEEIATPANLVTTVEEMTTIEEWVAVEDTLDSLHTVADLKVTPEDFEEDFELEKVVVDFEIEVADFDRDTDTETLTWSDNRHLDQLAPVAEIDENVIDSVEETATIAMVEETVDFDVDRVTDTATPTQCDPLQSINNRTETELAQIADRLSEVNDDKTSDKTSTVPQFATPDRSWHWLWPPYRGRKILKEIWQSELLPSVLQEDIWVLQAGQQWHGYSKKAWKYDDAEMARQAMRAQITWHLSAGPVLTEQRAIIVNPQDWRVWQVVAHQTTLAERLCHIWQSGSPTQIALETFRTAVDYLDILQQSQSYPVNLELTLERWGVMVSGQLTYLGGLEAAEADKPLELILDTDTVAERVKREFANFINNRLSTVSSALDLKEVIYQLEAIDGFEQQYVLEALVELMAT